MPSTRFSPSHALRLAALALTLLLGACATTPRAPVPGSFVPREVIVDGAIHRYQVFVPSPDIRQRRPAVVLFLHGSGERGNDNRRQTEVGLGPYLRAHALDFPAIAVFPQAAEGTSWTGAQARAAMAALDDAVDKFGGDDDRILLTGLSRGGYGVYELALMEPRRFAALAPVCGGITQSPALKEHLQVESVAMAPDPFAAAAQRLERLPVWAFHGGKDDVITPDQSRHMVEALRRVGGNVRYTEFAEAGHNAWDSAYATPELWVWAFLQKR
ncbi:prolyl oligopeptidase family serine peptidase [Lysobacter panacisoli]|uniref:Prolyl oligopeptidase family serine peptidase n=1 Tax=Lysobacter panacisoli TaxID=1255263 RepID=A0ABP9LHF5_9GAMM|nr:prolyl oligopeptidase family serine peptidase [Lysobacter panacisoli]